MKRFIMLVMTLGIVFACETSDTGIGQEAEQERLAEMKQEILDRIYAVPCENPEDWRPQALGSKPCGGPWEHVPYPHVADESGELLALIEEYTRQEAEYNERYNINSDCAEVPEPSGVECVDGRPELVDRGIDPPVIEE